MRKTAITTGEIYHICNRSTEGIKIFSSAGDARRFLRNLKAYNTTGEGLRGMNRRPRKVIVEEGDPLVEIYAIVLMPNHFHLLVKQLVEGGITKWMQRSCTSFSHSFNLIRNRKGTLFMGRFQAVPVLEAKQLFHLFVYIHSNPLDLAFPDWRNGKINNWVKAKLFLDSYRWSSFGLYVDGTKTVDEIKQLVSNAAFQKFISEWGGLENGIRDWGLRELEELTFILLE